MRQPALRTPVPPRRGPHHRPRIPPHPPPASPRIIHKPRILPARQRHEATQRAIDAPAHPQIGAAGMMMRHRRFPADRIQHPAQGEQGVIIALDPVLQQRGDTTLAHHPPRHDIGAGEPGQHRLHPVRCRPAVRVGGQDDVGAPRHRHGAPPRQTGIGHRALDLGEMHAGAGNGSIALGHACAVVAAAIEQQAQGQRTPRRQDQRLHCLEQMRQRCGLVPHRHADRDRRPRRPARQRAISPSSFPSQ